MSKRPKAALVSQPKTTKLVLSPEELKSMDVVIARMGSLGIKNHELRSKLLCQASKAHLQYWTKKSPLQIFDLTSAALTELGVTNLKEGMLVTQMLAVHDAAMIFLNQATVENQTAEGRDQYTNRAARLMEIFAQQTAALERLKGKAQQRVIVQHEHVHLHGGRGVWPKIGKHPAAQKLGTGHPARPARCLTAAVGSTVVSALAQKPQKVSSESGRLARSTEGSRGNKSCKGKSSGSS